MKKSIKLLIIYVIGIITGISIIISYANSYRSEEISYDNSTSHASATNVKDAIDYLYDHSICGSGMSCLESPTVTINVVGDGSVDKNSMIVPISGSNKIKVTPQDSYTLGNIECTNNYQISSYNVSREEQEIEITNPGVVVGSTCTVRFDAPVEVDIGSSTRLHSTYKSDLCNSNGEGCVCWFIKNYGSNFTYGSHTGCNFKSKSCYYTYGTYKDQPFDCEDLYFSGNYWAYDSIAAACSGVITCAT